MSHSSSIHIFNVLFNEEQAILEGLINNLSAVPVSERAAAVEDYLLRINRLSDKVKDATVYLPPYDTRMCAERIKGLSTKLSQARKAIAPKQKFAFKSKASLGPRETPVATHSPSPSTHSPIATATTPHASDHISISSLTSVYIQPPTPSQPSPISLSTLKSCFINLAPASNPHCQPSTLAVQSLTRSILFAPSIAGPAHLTSIRSSLLILSCAQFRMHDSHDTDVYLLCSSRPIIEGCSGIRFAPLPESWLRGTGGGPSATSNMWDQVDDFNWLKAEKSPNWGVIVEEDRATGGGLMEELNTIEGKLQEPERGLTSTFLDVERLLEIMGKGEHEKSS